MLIVLFTDVQPNEDQLTAKHISGIDSAAKKSEEKGESAESGESVDSSVVDSESIKRLKEVRGRVC
jgi:hypothetical protein